MEDNNAIVITGISGVFPGCENVEEFKEILYAEKNTTSYTDRRNTKIGENNRLRIGALKSLDRFDHTFFHITRKQARNMDITSRLLLERTFEAVVDAGYNLQQIKGKNIAVICGNCFDYPDTNVMEDAEHSNVFDKSRFMLANRISFWLDVHGPSVTLDSGCSSSLQAIDYAMKIIRSGESEGAIVCAANLCLLEMDSFFNMGVLSADGICRPFDADANGYVKAESIAVIFLQKKKDARRIYANVIQCMTNSDGFTEEGIHCPSAKAQKQMYKEFYKKLDIDPTCVSYIEAHGTGTQVGDAAEGTSFEEFFCPNRKTPLRIGSVKSNIGHTESTSGLCSLIKMLISFENNMIPATLNYKNPNPKIRGLCDGKLEVVTKPTSFGNGYVAINSFGVGGSNSHLLITPHNQLKNPTEHIPLNLPLIIAVSGRTKEAVDTLLNDVEKNHKDAEYVRLMHEIFSENTGGHPHRGYVILQKNKSSIKSKKFHSGEKRPIWFIFSGMGSQWPTMGKSLMAIPAFAESIHKSHRILQTKGVDLIKIITENDPAMFNNILHSFVGIAAIQIALIDVLKLLQIHPDGMIGHSVGELGCAYADGCFTAEQMILTAYYRGLVSNETELNHGLMAAVGQSHDIMKDLVPPGIDIACHNSSTNSTISGPIEEMKTFIEELKQKKVFVREVNTSNIAYHSRYIVPAAPKFYSYLKKIIPEPKLRSEKWICTSAPENQWSEDKTRYSSAEYHINNLLNPVYFQEGCRHIPSDAVTIEIAPHGLLNAILRHSLADTVENIPLTSSKHDDGVEFFFNALGRIYEVGYAPKFSNLYPTIEFPVSKSTPMISHLIKWQHSERWPIGKFHIDNTSSGERDIVMKPTSDDFKYITGHIVDGRNLFPAFGYLFFVWETVALMQKKKFTDVSIIFENVRFKRATNVPKTGAVQFHVSIQSCTKHFEVTESGVEIVSGTFQIPEDIDKEMSPVIPYKSKFSDSNAIPMNSKNIYKELKLKGYNFEGMFKKVVQANHEGTSGKILWCNNFVTFMDGMCHIPLLHQDCRELLIPIFFRKIIINVKRHFNILKTLDEKEPSCISSGGIQMCGWRTHEINRRRDEADPILEKYFFTPYISEQTMSLDAVIKICAQIVMENSQSIQIKSHQLLDREYNAESIVISKIIASAVANQPKIRANVNVLVNHEISDEKPAPHGIHISNEKLPKDKSCLLIILSEIRSKTHIFEQIFNALRDDGYIITKELIAENNSPEGLGLVVCFSRAINSDEKIQLLRKIPNKSEPIIPTIKITNDSYTWVPELQTTLASLQQENEKVVIYAEKDPMNGILGFFNCLRTEEKGLHTRCFFIMDESAPTFSLDHPFYKSQFDKNLSHNIYKNGEWGSYVRLQLEPVEDAKVTHAFCALEERGNLSSFQWIEGILDPLTYKSSPDKFLVHVYYSGLNFRDVMLSVGKLCASDLPDYSRFLESYQGIEFSGKNQNGERFMGFSHYKGISNMVEALSGLTWKVPDHISLEEAATIPVVYATVIYAFFVKIKLKKGASVLIHAGSGGVGQAAINICLHYQCNIFTTVSTVEKVDFIRRTYPQIPASQIGNSRNTLFEDLIMEQTNGRGVDVVLNSLSEDKLRSSLRCVAKRGSFLEIGKLDMINNNSLGLGHFVNEISFHSIQLDLLLSANIEEMTELQKKLQEMLDANIIKPLLRTVFSIEEVESAMRYIAAGKHMGKVLIKIREEEDKIVKPTPQRMIAKSRVLCQKNESYIIIGGLGGFGMELADWLILRGAKTIILSSRHGIRNGYQTYRTKIWKSYGVNVVIFTEDITKEIGVKNLLQKANSLGSVVGIFNTAAILQDNPFFKQTEDSFKVVTEPKASATIHLDKLSRKMCPNLQHFVVFSSVTCGFGNVELTNYGFANSIIERICEARYADNLPALAIQWGVIGEVGVVADFTEDEDIVIGGTVPQKVRSCLNCLNLFMKQRNPVVVSMVVAEKRHNEGNVIHSVANILGIRDLETINMTWTFPELGMDSILAIELKHILETEFDAFFTPENLRNMTFAKLHELKKEKQSPSNTTDKSVITQLEFFNDEKNINEIILRIPFDQNDIKNTHTETVFVFPGIEGLAITMETLAKNLPMQVLCFQYHNERISQFHHHQLREYFAELIIEKLDPHEEFHIIGYSMGGLYAIDVAGILESRGRKGYVCLIDSSPRYITLKTAQIAEKNDSANDDATKNYICSHLLQIILQKSDEELFNQIDKSNSWEAKKKLRALLLSNLSKNNQVMKQVMDEVYNKFKSLPNYSVSDVLLDSHCVLIRCADELFDLDESYGLSKYFRNPVQIHQLETDHFSISLHPKTAEIITEYFIQRVNRS